MPDTFRVGQYSFIIISAEVLFVILAPNAESVKHGRKAFAEFSQRIFYTRRNFCKHGTGNKTFLFHIPQLRGQDFLRNVSDGATKFAEALGSRHKVTKNQNFPLIPYQRQRCFYGASRKNGFNGFVFRKYHSQKFLFVTYSSIIPYGIKKIKSLRKIFFVLSNNVFFPRFQKSYLSVTAQMLPISNYATKMCVLYKCAAALYNTDRTEGKRYRLSEKAKENIFRYGGKKDENCSCMRKR